MARINIRSSLKQKFYLSPDAILRYLLMEDDKIDTLIMCKSSEVDLITTDFSLYEAIGSVKPDDDVKLNKLTKLFEVVNVISYKARMKETSLS